MTTDSRNFDAHHPPPAPPSREGGAEAARRDGDLPWATWFAAVRDPAIDAAVRGLFDRIDDAVRQRGPTCWVSGRCCNFDAYGHRLYVTGLETAWVVEQHEALQRAGHASQPPAVAPTGPCVFQINGMCSIHTIRPMGCRLFFCQEGTDDWQHEQYELFLKELRTLHDEHAIPYAYVEWRAALQAALQHI